MKANLRISVFIALCVVVIMATRPVAAHPTSYTFEEEVDAYIAETMRRLPIPGIAVGIVKGDQVLYLQGYGTANVNGDPVTPQTPFMLASVTKTFTALAVQQLAQAGQIDLDAPVQTYVPEFRLADEAAASAITVRHLLDHTSGISTIEGTQPYLHSPDTTFDEAIPKLARFTSRQMPGKQYQYSNWNYVLLGEIVSRTSSQSYSEYIQKNILDPLEMPHTTFADYHTLRDAATGNLIVFGASVPYDEPHLPIMLSAGYLSSTAEDMAHYLVAFLNQGQYQGKRLLASQGEGWYDLYWDWQPGRLGDLDYSFSGGHNSINTNIQLFSLYRVGVVVLMNTRLEQGIPAPTANDIAFNLARMVIQSHYEVPTNRVFYGGYAVLDGFLLLMIVSIFWQLFHWKGWATGYQNAKIPKRVAIWLGIFLELCIFIGILVMPHLLGTRWNIMLFFRPDFSIPVLSIALSMGILAVSKIIRSRL